MYGKTLEDFPERFEAFATVLQDLPLDAVNAGFQWCLKNSTEFPVPAEVRQAAESCMREGRIRAEFERMEREKRQLEAVKAQRFTPAIPERVELTPEQRDAETKRLEAEFREMLVEAKRKVSIP